MNPTQARLSRGQMIRPMPGLALALQILRERDPAKMATCGPLLYYLIKGLDSLPPLACDGTAYLWRGVKRPSVPPARAPKSCSQRDLPMCV